MLPGALFHSIVPSRKLNRRCSCRSRPFVRSQPSYSLSQNYPLEESRRIDCRRLDSSSSGSSENGNRQASQPVLSILFVVGSPHQKHHPPLPVWQRAASPTSLTMHFSGNDYYFTPTIMAFKLIPWNAFDDTPSKSMTTHVDLIASPGDQCNITKQQFQADLFISQSWRRKQRKISITSLLHATKHRFVNRLAINNPVMQKSGWRTFLSLSRDRNLCIGLRSKEIIKLAFIAHRECFKNLFPDKVNWCTFAGGQ